ncbi:hypothetical protein HMPREF3293_02427 [Christensenella minuta]|uniref:Uncharacterized protein n=1 Tax=Christensenella minuta TaxID=626937 RepID=A0A136Q3D0_9FIRM|nr:hypothetical protein HMPREF3293_02427 [Christensenella minuta]
MRITERINKSRRKINGISACFCMRKQFVLQIIQFIVDFSW